jgi:two-component system C4-dicarboxylate transport response regulator DctD
MTEISPRVFLVEDDLVVRRGSEQALALAGMHVRCFSDAESAVEALAVERPDAIVTDVRLPRGSGLDLMRQAHQHDADLPIVLVTGHGDVAMAVEAIRDGAYDFIEKPFSSDRLVDTVRRASERQRLIVENRKLRERLPNGDRMPILGASPAISDLRRRIAAVAPASVDVLVHGETGSGKELVARTLHALSGRTGHFVALNCAALPETLIESEIFGHEAGAFTGANRRRVGRIEYANGGTLFLDEIESMPLAVQLRFLRVLQERQIERLGSNETVPIDCRVIAATKEDLKALSAQGRFRADLYYRLDVVSLRIPPLRDRVTDIPVLMAYFLKEASARMKVQAPSWSEHDLLRWQQHEWPGNVRELQNVADRFCLGLDESLTAGDTASGTMSLAARMEAVERAFIRNAMAVAQGNVAHAAEILQIPRKTLYDKLHRFREKPAEQASDAPKTDPSPQ